MTFGWWRPPAAQDGAGEKIIDRLEEFEEKGWGSRELWELDPKDPKHGRHGLLFLLQPGWTIGRIGRAVVELIGPRDGNGARARLAYTRRERGELQLDPTMANLLRHELRCVEASVAKWGGR